MWLVEIQRDIEKEGSVDVGVEIGEDKRGVVEGREKKNRGIEG